MERVNKGILGGCQKPRMGQKGIYQSLEGVSEGGWGGGGGGGGLDPL